MSCSYRLGDWDAFVNRRKQDVIPKARDAVGFVLVAALLGSLN